MPPRIRPSIGPSGGGKAPRLGRALAAKVARKTPSWAQPTLDSDSSDSEVTSKEKQGREKGTHCSYSFALEDASEGSMGYVSITGRPESALSEVASINQKYAMLLERAYNTLDRNNNKINELKAEVAWLREKWDAEQEAVNIESEVSETTRANDDTRMEKKRIEESFEEQLKRLKEQLQMLESRLREIQDHAC
ncbi:hypothetical protein VNI00_015019 [Paramarasmius palmivorus]|uniref:Uncharacterized protein n=1 Tax=Paramarasmius palmivorus TaxID=297713 RepID=A0AAW0BN45_9AGAR